MPNQEIVMKGRTTVALVMLFAFSAQAQDTVPTEPPERPYDYDFTARDRHLYAMVCVHEVSWRDTADCGAFLQVIMERRNEGETFDDAVHRTMPHFYASLMAARGAPVTPCPEEGDEDAVCVGSVELSRRRWVAELPNGPLRRNPEHWPYDYPARVHADDWVEANNRARDYMLGFRPLPYTERVVRWFGRVTDGEQLTRALADGWCEAVGPLSLNAFLFPC